MYDFVVVILIGDLEIMSEPVSYDNLFKNLCYSNFAWSVQYGFVSNC